MPDKLASRIEADESRFGRDAMGQPAWTGDGRRMRGAGSEASGGPGSEMCGDGLDGPWRG